MPYLTRKDRERVVLRYQGKGSPQCAGEMNYLFTLIMQRYLKEHGVSYQTVNDCLGAIEGAKMEFYRRMVAPYEDEKIKQNGDVNVFSDED